MPDNDIRTQLVDDYQDQVWLETVKMDSVPRADAEINEIVIAKWANEHDNGLRGSNEAFNGFSVNALNVRGRRRQSQSATTTDGTGTPDPKVHVFVLAKDDPESEAERELGIFEMPIGSHMHLRAWVHGQASGDRHAFRVIEILFFRNSSGAIQIMSVLRFTLLRRVGFTFPNIPQITTGVSSTTGDVLIQVTQPTGIASMDWKVDYDLRIESSPPGWNEPLAST
jgi:hypothetical protein